MTKAAASSVTPRTRCSSQTVSTKPNSRGNPQGDARQGINRQMSAHRNAPTNSALMICEKVTSKPIEPSATGTWVSGPPPAKLNSRGSAINSAPNSHLVVEDVARRVHDGVERRHALWQQDRGVISREDEPHADNSGRHEYALVDVMTERTVDAEPRTPARDGPFVLDDTGRCRQTVQGRRYMTRSASILTAR